MEEALLPYCPNVIAAIDALRFPPPEYSPPHCPNQILLCLRIRSHPSAASFYRFRTSATFRQRLHRYLPHFPALPSLASQPAAPQGESPL